jgi:hypothetical protein
VDGYRVISTLTGPNVSEEERSSSLDIFASELGWEPSDHLDAPTVRDIANAHLMVEHGLENTAVITFLRYPYRYSQLEYADRNRLLSISYNNLVDWHINVERDAVSFVYGRADPPKLVERYAFETRSYDRTLVT